MDKFKRLTDSLEKRGKKPLALYIHIPFCARKCGYCDFLSFPSTEEKMRSYMEQLRRELLFRAGKPGADCSDDTEYLLHSQYEIISIFLLNSVSEKFIEFNIKLMKNLKSFLDIHQ